MPDNALGVEVKIKTRWGKYTLFQDTYTCMEKYCSWDRADRRSSIHTRRRRTLQREVMSSNNNTNTNSETDVPVGEGLGYPLQVFTDPEFATNVSHSEDELSIVEEIRLNFIREYCKKCTGKHYRCWCNSSDWDEDLIDIENPTKNTDPNLESEKHLKHPLDNPLQDGLNLEERPFPKNNPHTRE